MSPPEKNPHRPETRRAPARRCALDIPSPSGTRLQWKSKWVDIGAECESSSPSSEPPHSERLQRVSIVGNLERGRPVFRSSPRRARTGLRAPEVNVFPRFSAVKGILCLGRRRTDREVRAPNCGLLAAAANGGRVILGHGNRPKEPRRPRGPTNLQSPAGPLRVGGSR